MNESYLELVGVESVRSTKAEAWPIFVIYIGEARADWWRAAHPTTHSLRHRSHVTGGNWYSALCYVRIVTLAVARSALAINLATYMHLYVHAERMKTVG